MNGIGQLVSCHVVGQSRVEYRTGTGLEVIGFTLIRGCAVMTG